MSTVIVTTHESATTTHYFKATTHSGREMKIQVAAMSDIKPEAVLKDVRLAIATDVEIDDEENSDNPIVVAFFLWLMLGVALFLGFVLTDMSKIINYDHVISMDLPWIGGLSVGMSIFRGYLALFPLSMVISTIMFFVQRKNK